MLGTEELSQCKAQLQGAKAPGRGGGITRERVDQFGQNGYDDANGHRVEQDAQQDEGRGGMAWAHEVSGRYQ